MLIPVSHSNPVTASFQISDIIGHSLQSEERPSAYIYICYGTEEVMDDWNDSGNHKIMIQCTYGNAGTSSIPSTQMVQGTFSYDGDDTVTLTISKTSSSLDHSIAAKIPYITIPRGTKVANFLFGNGMADDAFAFAAGEGTVAYKG